MSFYLLYNLIYIFSCSCRNEWFN